MSVEHWMMFATFKEQRHFIYPRPDTYNGAIINGNMAAHASEGVAGFLLEKTGRMKYLVDPLTHAFQHAPSSITTPEGEVKSSIQRLAEHYGTPVKESVGKHAVVPDTFSDTSVFEGFVSRCLDFQSCRLPGIMKDSDTMKYLTAADEAKLYPHALIAPYFYMQETSFAAWLPVMRKAIELSKKASPKYRIFGAVVLSRALLLDTAALNEIADELNAEDPHGYVVWIDSFDEQTAAQVELKGLLGLVRRLRKGNKEVINLHGGYFSILAGGTLGKHAFTGVTHGPEFGEHRAVVPVGGGIPIARYYVPQLHVRVKYREARAIFDALGWLKDAKVFHGNVCDCEECKATLDGNIANFVRFGESTPKLVRRKGGTVVRIDYPTSETSKRCLQHYLQRKALEYRFADTPDGKDVIVNELKQGMLDYQPVIGLDGVSHLAQWLKCLAPESA